MGWWYMRQKHLRWFCTLCNGHIPLFLRCFSKLNLSKSLQWEEWSNTASSTGIICYVCTLLFPIDIPVSFQTVTVQGTVVRTEEEGAITLYSYLGVELNCIYEHSDAAWQNPPKEASDSLNLYNMGFTLCTGLRFLSSENALNVLYAQKTVKQY